MPKSSSFSPPEEKILRKLGKSDAITEAQLKPEPGVLKRLLSSGLVKEIPPEAKRGKAKFTLSEAGRAAALRLPKEKVTQADLYREILSLREEVSELKELILAGPPAAPAAASPEPPSDTGAPRAPEGAEDFGSSLLWAIGELNRRGRYGGLIPIPSVRKVLSGLKMSRKEFDEALLEQERAFAIDLKTAHDPQSLTDRKEGISDPGRGVLYYVVKR